MEEQERRIEGEKEDVEGHGRRKAQMLASEEPTGDEEGDVEGHRRKAQAMASDEPTAEGDEDDVEAHALRHRPQSL